MSILVCGKDASCFDIGSRMSKWDLIAGLFPPPKPTGWPRDNARDMIDGILWILNTGAQWRDLPPAFGPKSTVWDHFDQWNNDGTLMAALDRLRRSVDVNNELWCVDGTIVRAAKCAAGGGKREIRTNRTTMRSAAVAAV